MRAAWLALVASLVASGPLRAAEPAASPDGELALDIVLQASRTHAPLVLEALAKTRSAQGLAAAAQGAFDLVFSADGESPLVSGKYDGTLLGAQLRQPFATNGGYVYGDYGYARGSFPPYSPVADGRVGELKVGAVFALLRDRNIDPRRFELQSAELESEVVATEGAMVAIGVQRRAMDAYYRWVTSGLRLRTYRQLLRLAEDRQTALGRQVELGRLASLVLVENQQNIFRRRALVTQSEREFETAANQLSLFYRDGEGKPLVAQASQLPGELTFLPSLQPDVRAVYELRPDLQGLRAKLEQAAVKLDYGQNLLLPRVDARFGLAQDVADPFRGRLGGDGTEAVVGLSVSVPLQRREARGKVASAKAEMEAIRYRRQAIEEQVKADIAAIGIAIDATDRLFQISRQEQEQALRMAEAERVRFQNGASDFFLVNLREESAADAAVRQLNAGLERASARADLVALSADLRLLGLAPGP